MAVVEFHQLGLEFDGRLGHGRGGGVCPGLGCGHGVGLDFEGCRLGVDGSDLGGEGGGACVELGLAAFQTGRL